MNNDSYTTSNNLKRSIATIVLMAAMEACPQYSMNFGNIVNTFDRQLSNSDFIEADTSLSHILYNEDPFSSIKGNITDAENIAWPDDNDSITKVKVNLFDDYLIINKLSHAYSITDSAQDYLLTNLFLWPLLVELKDEIKKYFDDELYIETIIDPEDNDESLFLGINTNLDFDLAMERFDMFIKKWWLNNMGRAENKLDIDVMFI